MGKTSEILLRCPVAEGLEVEEDVRFGKKVFLLSILMSGYLPGWSGTPSISAQELVRVIRSGDLCQLK